jgi:hypothetical protein
MTILAVRQGGSALATHHGSEELPVNIGGRGELGPIAHSKRIAAALHLPAIDPHLAQHGSIVAADRPSSGDDFRLDMLQTERTGDRLVDYDPPISDVPFENSR